MRSSSNSIAQNPTNPCPSELLDQLIAVPVRFATFLYGIEGRGTIEVHRALAPDIEELFRYMLAWRFPLSCALPVAYFDWDEELSMVANNTSGFNYRMIANTERLSKHAFGRAIDINPFFNPCIREAVIRPVGAAYDPLRLGTLKADSLVVQFLKARGWTWGGDWTSLKDYQHFEKPE